MRTVCANLMEYVVQKHCFGAVAQNGLGGLGGWGAGLTEVSEGRAGTFPHPSAAAQQAVGPQPTLQKI